MFPISKDFLIIVFYYSKKGLYKLIYSTVFYRFDGIVTVNFATKF